MRKREREREKVRGGQRAALAAPASAQPARAAAGRIVEATAAQGLLLQRTVRPAGGAGLRAAAAGRGLRPPGESGAAGRREISRKTNRIALGVLIEGDTILTFIQQSQPSEASL